MIKIEDVLSLHTDIVSRTGGADGLRDRDVLDSALARPFQTFGGEDLYPSLLEKMAALAESIIVNHPFIDGNKRIGFMVMYSFLYANGYDITANDDERYDFVIAVASGELRYDGIIEWLQNNTQEL